MTSWQHDALGRVITTTLPDPDGGGGQEPPELSTSYDAMGRVLTETDALGNVTTFQWDNLGRLIERTEAGVDRAAAMSNPKAIGIAAKRHKSRKGCSLPGGSLPGLCDFCDSLRQKRLMALEFSSSATRSTR